MDQEMREKTREFYLSVYHTLTRKHKKFVKAQLSSSKLSKVNKYGETNTAITRYPKLKEWIVFVSPNGKKLKIFRRNSYQHAEFLYYQHRVHEYGGFPWYVIGTLGTVMRHIPRTDSTEFEMWLSANIRLIEGAEKINLTKLAHYCNNRKRTCTADENPDPSFPCLCNYFREKYLTYEF